MNRSYSLRLALIAIFSAACSMAAAQGIITSIAGNGVTQYIGDGVPATNYSLGFPYGLCLDASGSVYVADYIDCRIRRIHGDTLFTIAGLGTPGYTGDGGPAAAATFHNSAGICMDTAGNLYISEEYNDVVRKITKTTGIVSTVCGSGTGGYGGDNGPALAANMERPAGLCLDKAGNIYIADFGNLRIRKMNVATGIISTVAGTGANGYTGDNGPAINASLSYPRAVCTDTAGNLYIADYGNNCIRKVSAATGYITTIAGTGVAGYSGDDGLATAAMLRQPNGIFMSSQGILYISDFGNNVIRAVSAEGIIYRVAGNGNYGFTGDGGPALDATLHGPTGVCVDAAGFMYIADGENSAIRKVTPHALTVKQTEAAPQLSVVPNPSGGRFSIQGCNSGTARLYNALGQQLCIMQLANGNNVMEAGNVPAGTFYLSVINELGVTNARVVIVK